MNRRPWKLNNVQVGVCPSSVLLGIFDTIFFVDLVQVAV